MSAASFVVGDFVKIVRGKHGFWGKIAAIGAVVKGKYLLIGGSVALGRGKPSLMAIYWDACDLEKIDVVERATNVGIGTYVRNKDNGGFAVFQVTRVDVYGAPISAPEKETRIEQWRAMTNAEVLEREELTARLEAAACERLAVLNEKPKLNGTSMPPPPPSQRKSLSEKKRRRMNETLILPPLVSSEEEVVEIN